MMAVPALALAALAALVMVAPRAEGNRVKGAPRLLIFRQRLAGQAEALHDENPVQPHDVLQLGYASAGARYGVIASVDSRGQVTLHFPEERGGSTLLEQRDPSMLLHAYELDDTPGFERFYFVTSATPLTADQVLLAVGHATGSAPNLVLDTHARQTVVTLRKTTNP